MEPDIFIKRSDIEPKNIKLIKDDVLGTIPTDAVKKKDDILCLTNIEWRWRIFKIPKKDNEVIEISFKRPGEKRWYINKMGEWITRNVSSEFDQYIIDEYYNYSSE
jgi:hypothetical protein